jgi:5-methylcytosine-specific restriction endonuclease McrA
MWLAAKNLTPPARPMMLASICPGCGVVLPAGSGGRCAHCSRPQRSGSSRPELDRYAWQRLRRAARLRDGNRCIRCGSSERLHVHHTVPGSNLLEDLVTLCSRCHGREHTRIKLPANKPVFRGEARHAPTPRSPRVSSRDAESGAVVARPSKTLQERVRDRSFCRSTFGQWHRHCSGVLSEMGGRALRQLGPPTTTLIRLSASRQRVQNGLGALTAKGRTIGQSSLFGGFA